VRTDSYENPLITRYASEEMAALFSDDEKFRTWRRLWVALAQSQRELGLPITEEQIEEMRAHIDDIDYETAAQIEKEVRHDVMAHVIAYGRQCPLAKPIIHLGATSCYVGDNTDLIIMHKAIQLVRKKLINLFARLADFALSYKDLPTLGFTHYQPAQLTTVGKRASLWLQDFYLDYEEMTDILRHYRLRGVKGTTGTQASFLILFDGDSGKVKQLEKLVMEKMGFADYYPVTGQTYPRKFDTRVLNWLSSLAQSAHKMATDIRLLQHQKEIEEPFENKQIGSSAMAYKRNPMRSERLCALARFVLANAQNPAMTASVQWLERTLDDSANRRVSIPQGFLAVDGILNLLLNITDGLVVYPKVIGKHIQDELPFMATETILMEAVKRGGDRQALHEKIRRYSMEAARRVKEEGKPGNLIGDIANDEAFSLSLEEIEALLDPRKFTGMAEAQTESFIRDYIQPILDENKDILGIKSELNV
jgi:adenylosuccinate lyase